MKTIKIIMMFLLVGTVMGVSAQKKATKIATIDSQKLLQMMPEYDSIQTVYNREYSQIQQTGQQMYADLQRLQQEYTAKKTV